MTEFNPFIVTLVTIVIASIDILLQLLTFGWVKGFKSQAWLLLKGMVSSVPVKKDVLSERCHPDYIGKPAQTYDDSIETLYDLVKKSCERYGDDKCMADREFIGWKTSKVREFGKTRWKTYNEVSRNAHAFGAALRGDGMVCAPDTTTLEKVTTPSRLAIFENTCPEWMIGCLGAITQGITVTTVYATLGMDAVVEAIQENIIPVIVCNRKHVGKVVEHIQNMPTLKTIVYTNDQLSSKDQEAMTLPKPPKGVKIISFDEYVKSGDTETYPPTPPKPDSCAVVMYTSGSTGKPKGVILTQAQVLGGCSAFHLGLGEFQEPGDCYLAYLPLAHIFEFASELTTFALGMPLMYADTKSLTSTGAYPVGALEQYQPTIMAGVPKVWDIIKKGVQAKFQEKSVALQYIIQAAFEWRTFCQSYGYDISKILDLALFGTIKKATGGRLKVGISGGGPLNREVQDFTRAAFGIMMKQGYGLTETCGALSVQLYEDNRAGVVGGVLSSVQVKLVSTPEIPDKAGQPYLSKDKYDVDGMPVCGRGEIVVKGTNIATGYYLMPDKTEEVFVDGWFHTGDIGQFTPDGAIQIVDRKKNLVKLKGGEYIALERMEMVYNNCPFVDAIGGGVCCYGDGDMDRPVALLQLSEKATMKWAATNGVEGDFKKVMQSPELVQAILESCKVEHKKSDLSHIEKLVGVALLTEHWTPENGCLTAANKLQRRVVAQTFAKELEEVRKKGIFK